MKKLIISTLSVLLFLFVVNFPTSAMGIERLPLKNTGEITTLTKKVAVSADLNINEDELLKIPDGKRLTIKKGKTLSVEGVLFIENGGQLKIEKGQLKIGKDALIICSGTLNVEKGSEIVMKKGGALICLEKSDFILDGSFSAETLDDFTAVCLGNYKGSFKEIGTKALAAVSFKEASWLAENGDNYKTYNGEEIADMIPDEPILSEEQTNAAGALYEHLNVFFNNGQVLTLLYRGNDISTAGEITVRGVKLLI